jgi:sugar phosphate isomerase/epimerase
MEIGVMFWAGSDPIETFRQVKGTGVRCGQLGVPPEMPLVGAAPLVKAALADVGLDIVTVFAAYRGESYADIPTVQRTVGFIPAATRVEREKRTLQISDFAAGLGVASIACHVGFIPEDAGDPGHTAVREMVRRVADHAARNGQTFALETGQEPAPVLLAFLKDVDRPNVRINFDPANLILYGTGDPIEALGVLAPYVVSAHCKDGDWPQSPGLLGVERPLGQGAVGIERFLAALKKLGYDGTLNVESGIHDEEQHWQAMTAAVSLLRRLSG